MTTLASLDALEILDSRGRPTVQATCVLASGARGTASVPSGASTGAAEAYELRDGDPARFRGLGCKQAVAHVKGEIARSLAGRAFASQRDLDDTLVRLDGTLTKSRLGANAILATSIAFARASAAERGMPLHDALVDLVGPAPTALPRPMINLFSGGKHAGGQVPIQDVLVIPRSPHTMDALLAMTFDVYQAAADLCLRHYGMRALTADEGGLAPAFPSAEAMLESAVESIRSVGLEPGRDVVLAVDVAASHFFDSGRYRLGGEALDGPAMIDRVIGWIASFPIVSVEDGLAEDDWAHWPELRARAAGRARIVGDDLLCTNPERIRRAIDARAADALLLKVNQIGTLAEAAASCALARSAGWQVVVSARSGETEDDWLADLAVAWSADAIKVGSITQSERLAKYNRLLAIEQKTRWPLGPGVKP